MARRTMLLWEKNDEHGEDKRINPGTNKLIVEGGGRRNPLLPARYASPAKATPNASLSDCGRPCANGSSGLGRYGEEIEFA